MTANEQNTSQSSVRISWNFDYKNSLEKCRKKEKTLANNHCNFIDLR